MDMKYDCIYLNGCSYTYGSELNDISLSYGNNLGRHYNLPVINNAKPGSSNHRILRTSFQDIDRLLEEGKNPLVLIGWSEPLRFELCRLDNNEWVQFTGHNDPDPKVFRAISEDYNSDYGQLETFFTQLTSMESFIKVRQLSSLQYNIFPTHWQVMPDKVISWIDKLDKTMFLNFHFNIAGYLTIQHDLDTMPKGHPGPIGHKHISDLLIKQLSDRKII